VLQSDDADMTRFLAANTVKEASSGKMPVRQIQSDWDGRDLQLVLTSQAGMPGRITARRSF